MTSNPWLFATIVLVSALLVREFLDNLAARLSDRLALKREIDMLNARISHLMQEHMAAEHTANALDGRVERLERRKWS